MTTRGHAIHVKIDKQGVVEVGGMTRGQNEAAEVAKLLGLGAYEGTNLMFTVIRSETLPPETVAAVKARADELGYDLEEVGALEAVRSMKAAMSSPSSPGGEIEGSSTIAALHAHKLGPSRREKMILPLVLVALLALFLGVGSVVRDHMNHAHQPVSTLGEVVAMSQTPPAGGGGLAGFINPDDSQFASLAVRGWPFWNGKAAILDDHYIRIPGLLEPSIEKLVKGDQGGATVIVLKFDARPREDGTYGIDVIDRGGLPTKNEDLDAEIFPLVMGPEPSVGVAGDRLTYVDGAGIRHDRDETFRGVSRVALSAWVEKAGTGLRLWSEGCAMALDGEVDPGLAALMEDLAVSEETLDRMVAGNLPADDRIELNRMKVTWFLTVEEIFPWREGGEPGRRQLTREVGAARVDGALVRRLYIKNGAA